MTLQGMSLSHPEFKQPSHFKAHERMARDNATTDFCLWDWQQAKGAGNRVTKPQTTNHNAVDSG